MRWMTMRRMTKVAESYDTIEYDGTDNETPVRRRGAFAVRLLALVMLVTSKSVGRDGRVLSDVSLLQAGHEANGVVPLVYTVRNCHRDSTCYGKSRIVVPSWGGSCIRNELFSGHWYGLSEWHRNGLC